MRNWAQSGQLRAIRHPINGFRLFDPSDVEALLNSLNPQKEQLPLFFESAPYNFSLKPHEIQEDGDLLWLTSKAQSNFRDRDKYPSISVGDAFCGGGIFSLGISEALLSNGLNPRHLFGMDFDSSAISCFQENFPDAIAYNSDINTLIDGVLGQKSTEHEKKFAKAITSQLHILVGGPPCQGHSDLNNHTRRNDPKNALILKMARLAEITRPSLILIENVPGVTRDKTNALQMCIEGLERLGYGVTMSTIDLSKYGLPQRRKRFILVGVLNSICNIEKLLSNYARSERPLSWAIKDLTDRYDPSDTFNSSAQHSKTNTERINYLFENRVYDLPDALRPPCHRDKNHSYKSVYGRMHWDSPSPTITGGFGSTGQGRFVHPIYPRTLTPHEAARLQFIPDFYRFPKKIGRRDLQQIIGNAAPPLLSRIILSGILKKEG